MKTRKQNLRMNPSAHTSSHSTAPVDENGLLKAWILEQAVDNAAPFPAIMEALVSGGWNAEQIQPVVQTAIRDAFPAYTGNPGVANLHPAPMPEPWLPDGATHVDCGDRKVEVVMASIMPRLVVFEGFLSDDECDQLIEQAKPRLTRSGVIQPMSGASMVTDIRTSQGMFFNLGESTLVDKIEKRIARLVNWPVVNGEGLQVLNYQQHAEYKPHQDFFDPADPGTPQQLALAGQRVATLLMYLNTPQSGGGTAFPDAGMEVKAKKGRAVLFSYCLPSAAFRTLHGGMPVLAGEKWAATKWLRRRPIVPANMPRPKASA